jgi:hypothetical protein
MWRREIEHEDQIEGSGRRRHHGRLDVKIKTTVKAGGMVVGAD